MTDDHDPDKTPPHTPSAMRRLGLVQCPKCKGAPTVECDLCGNGRMIAVDDAIRWSLNHGDTDPAT